MVVKNSNHITVPVSKLSVFCNDIMKSGMFVKELNFKYVTQTQRISLHVEGDTSVSLTNEFTESMAIQVKRLIDDVLIPLSEFVNCTFFMIVKVDSDGLINYKDLQVQFHIDCRKFENSFATLHDRFRTPFQILMPFAEYIDFISVKGFNFDIAGIEVELNIELEDLMDVIQTPFVGPRAKKDWYLFIQKASIEAKNEHAIDVKIPVHDGEVTWHVPQLKKMKFIDTVRKLKD